METAIPELDTDSASSSTSTGGTGSRAAATPLCPRRGLRPPAAAGAPCRGGRRVLRLRHRAARGAPSFRQVDLNEESVAQAFAGQEFDVVFLGEVIEHVFSPDALLEDVRRCFARTACSCSRRRTSPTGSTGCCCSSASRRSSSRTRQGSSSGGASVLSDSGTRPKGTSGSSRTGRCATCSPYRVSSCCVPGRFPSGTSRSTGSSVASRGALLRTSCTSRGAGDRRGPRHPRDPDPQLARPRHPRAGGAEVLTHDTPDGWSNAGTG